MFTFGIITAGYNQYLHKCVQSIKAQTEGEIIIIGLDKSHSFGRVRCFDSGPEQPGQPFEICRKKNIITAEAQFDNIVFTHDYIEFQGGWIAGWKKFSETCEWDIGMNVIYLQDGETRFRDWCVWADPRYGETWVQREPWCKQGLVHHGKSCLVPYTYGHTDRMYINGSYWLAKKHVMESEPLNPQLRWGEAEDVEWSMRVRSKFKYRMNTQSVCRLLKPKDVIIPYVDLQNE